MKRIILILLLAGCSTQQTCRLPIVVTSVTCPKGQSGPQERFCRLEFSDGSEFFVGESAGIEKIKELKGQTFCSDGRS